MSASFHINFNGQCEQAFEYYAEHLGGEIGLMLKVKDSPMSVTSTAEIQDNIVHANIAIQGVEIAGGDLLPEQYQKPQGFCVLLGLDNEQKVKNTFDKLAVGGEVILAPQKTFWSRCYAIVTDQFGVPWKLNCSD
ncbi:VOC family protein [Paraglaciecola aquimarina]|uniref:VOC family protein n=1 Tax=Paraglaciecola algarum TaxID=3050085 RepID=A0ABS9D135_9ALTE|nr:VOC family protein [Paraglaciecola sp. G1-23]MCF2946640.1 VOC family protein [Paraglaciecola sp. G1-23]